MFRRPKIIPMDIDVNIATKMVALRIQEERQKRKMSQMELALEAGISQGFLAMIEASRKIPTVTTISKIANALSVKPSIFFEIPDSNREEQKEKIISLIRSL